MQHESIIIMDQFGVLLAHPNAELVRQQTNLSNLKIFRHGLKQDSNLVYENMGAYFYGSSTLVKSVGWVVVDQIAVAELLKPYALSTGIIIIITFLIFMALVLNLRDHLQRLVAGPLMQLSRKTTALANGDYNAVNEHALIYDGFAELNKLSEDFLGMSVALEARQQELKESQEQYHSLFEQVPVGLFRFAADGTIITANRAFKKILHISQEQNLSKVSIFDVCTYNPGQEQLKTIFEQTNRQYFESQIHCCDGSLVWVLIRWSAVRDADGQILYYDGTLADISERMQAQEALQQAKDELEVKVEQRTGELFCANQELKAMNEEIAAVNELLEVANLRLNEENQLRRQELLEQTRSKNKYLEALHEISLGLLNQLDIDILLNNVVHNACDLFETKDGYIALVDQSGEMAEIKIGLGHYGESIGFKFRQNEGITGMVLKTGETKVVENYQQWPYRLNDSLFSGLQTGTAAPLKIGDKVIGVLSTDFFDNPRHFTGDDIAILDKFAALASVAVKNANLYNEAQQEISNRKKAQEALAVSEEKFNKAFHYVADIVGIVKLDNGRYVEINDAFTQVFGYKREEIIGRTSLEMGLWQKKAEYTKLYSALQTNGRIHNCEVSWRTKDGEIRIGLDSAEVFEIGDEKFVVYVWHDITERKQAEEKLRQKAAEIHEMAFSDPLTKLPNRAAMNVWLSTELAKARKGKAHGILMFIDFDDLKLINDTFGHSYGDAIIILGGNRIAAEAGENAFVARIGGDEFIVVIPGRGEPQYAEDIASRIINALGREHEISETKFHISASVGITKYPQDGDSVDELLKNADNAMYAAKKAGKNCWRFYTEAMQREAYERMVLTNSLRYALDREELFLQYQPQIQAKTGRIIGVEALLRWNSLEHGAIAPSRFIPLAEQSGLIHTIGQWVIREACRFICRLGENGYGNIRVAVNVSPQQLSSDDFIYSVHQLLKEENVKAGQLELEITESALMVSMEDAINKLDEFRQLGIGLSLDDFGVGYSSLNNLRHLPVNTLKIDKSFIDKLETDTEIALIISYIINMAHALSMTVVAEGVETNEQLSYLAEKGCDFIQGYVFSRPVNEQDIFQLLAANKFE